MTDPVTFSKRLLPSQDENGTIEAINALIDARERPGFIYVYAANCGACEQAIGKVDQLAQENEDIVFCKIDATAVPEVWDAFALASVPACLIVGNGGALSEFPGALKIDAMRTRIANARMAMADAA